MEKACGLWDCKGEGKSENRSSDCEKRLVGNDLVLLSGQVFNSMHRQAGTKHVRTLRAVTGKTVSMQDNLVKILSGRNCGNISGETLL